MKQMNKLLAILLATTSLYSNAESGASDNASAASKHSALAASHGTAASAKIGSAVVATPLLVVGSVGQASTSAGTALMEQAVKAEPLEITEKTVTAAPSPKQVMKASKQENL
ncbi:hypothetical protein LP316_15190 [Thalassotalea sp. LPB0316]|uniref:hypothetical protein n=1 Tax=Thalassotalea sp. LPB0316 TaxID=2769490 RepID=UPI001868CC2C|nr:hypothetical protein [Thalassotalea sp. LPB0316]QOL25615.1 hypothetical protein LP316_15190 [Thalassotalea sp. LPB0316]